LCGESGEFADHVKKHIAQGHALSPRQLALELGDVMWYVAIAATVLGYDLSEIAAMNEVKLAKRFADGHTVAEDVARKDVGDV
jgi:NTP pyrophosphatase (non-canonical NTP hydrolase)